MKIHGFLFPTFPLPPTNFSSIFIIVTPVLLVPRLPYSPRLLYNNPRLLTLRLLLRRSVPPRRPLRCPLPPCPRLPCPLLRPPLPSLLPRLAHAPRPRYVSILERTTSRLRRPRLVPVVSRGCYLVLTRASVKGGIAYALSALILRSKLCKQNKHFKHFRHKHLHSGLYVLVPRPVPRKGLCAARFLVRR